jgi:hypothetical protein
VDLGPGLCLSVRWCYFCELPLPYGRGLPGVLINY